MLSRLLLICLQTGAADSLFLRSSSLVYWIFSKRGSDHLTFPYGTLLLGFCRAEILQGSFVAWIKLLRAWNRHRLGVVIKGNQLGERFFLPPLPQNSLGFTDFAACKEMDVELGWKQNWDSSNHTWSWSICICFHHCWNVQFLQNQAQHKATLMHFA